jgi:hypothetical protein
MKVDRHVARGTVVARGHGLGVRGKKLGIRANVDAAAAGAAMIKAAARQITFD